MCEDYRAGLRIDRAHEEADRIAGRRVTCPMLFLQSAHDDIDIHGDPLAIWRSWVAGSLSAGVIDSGHHQAEEAPAELAAALTDFLESTGQLRENQRPDRASSFPAHRLGG
jgi:haloacetate dehalogenase